MVEVIGVVFCEYTDSLARKIAVFQIMDSNNNPPDRLRTVITLSSFALTTDVRSDANPLSPMYFPVGLHQESISNLNSRQCYRSSREWIKEKNLNEFAKERFNVQLWSWGHFRWNGWCCLHVWHILHGRGKDTTEVATNMIDKSD